MNADDDRLLDAPTSVHDRTHSGSAAATSPLCYEKIALHLAEEFGLPVFPCWETHPARSSDGKPVGRKSPRIDGGFKSASRDRAVIEAWWARWPNALIGVPTGAPSGLFVIDIDPDGQAWYEEHADHLQAGRIHTTERGWHLLYRNADLPTTASTLERGVDTRGVGGYIIWWPASTDKIAIGTLEDTGPVPQWIVDALQNAPRSTGNSRRHPVAVCDPASSGDRSRDLLRRVADEVRAGRADYEIVQLHRNHPHARDQADADRAVQRCIDKARSDTVTYPIPLSKIEPSYSTDLSIAISDDQLAQRFSERHADEFLFCAELRGWLQWRGTHFAPDKSKAVIDAARLSCRQELNDILSTETNEAKRRALRIRLGSAATVAAVINLAAADRRHAVTNQQLDTDLLALNTPGGIIDLKTGALRQASPAKLLTKITAAAPSTECPTFLRVLERAVPDPEVRHYLQRLTGYLMTGVVSEHVVVLIHGSGGNGKSLIFNSIKYALGDYAVTLGSEVLMESHNDRHPTEIAVLRGARLALCSEVDSGRRWNETRLKRLSGGDPITARVIAGDPFEFNPSHKLVLLANAKPGLRQVDEAIRRRIHLVEFKVTIPPEERDPNLPEILRAEAGGILGWGLAGCLDWQAGGLRPPHAVLDATNTYLDHEDVIGEWIRERCHPSGQSSLTDLYASYRIYAEENGQPILGRNTFGDLLETHGVARIQIKAKVFRFSGLTPIQRDRLRHGA
jgi:putative DNA primase/helicase